MSSLTLLTHYVPTPKEDYTELADLIVPARESYCARHGYKHLVQRGMYGGFSYYAYGRLKLLRDYLDSPDATQFVWVLNVQSVLTNHTKQVTDVLDDEHDAYLTKDCHGLNLGSFVVRNTPWTKSWLDFIISLEPNYRFHPWHEQKAFMDFWLHENWTWMIHLLPQRALNSYQYQRYKPWPPHTPGNWRLGDLVLSLPGLNLQQRLEIVRSKEIQDSIIT